MAWSRAQAAPAAGAVLPQRGTWQELIRKVLGNPAARHFFFYLIILLAAILGQDVLLEPYAGEAFGLPVRATTRITSIWGTCVLVTLLAAGLLERRMDKRTSRGWARWAQSAGFLLIAASGLVRPERAYFTAAWCCWAWAPGFPPSPTCR